MRKVILFIAMSLDGYIADENGNVDWLCGQAPNQDDMQSYTLFKKEIDTVIMGGNTYYQLVNEISPQEWMYPDFFTYVITHKQEEPRDKIKFMKQNPVELVSYLRKQKGKHIWICGGANIAQQLMEADEVDRFYISIIPTLLGKGIPLFSKMQIERKLRLVDTKHYNGIVDVVYERRV